jgi:hypothetical protein
VCLIIQPYYPKSVGRPTGIIHASAPPEHLAYVQYFNFSHVIQQGDTLIPQVNKALNMYEVRRSNLRVGGIPKGDIIPLSLLWQPVQLVPKFNGAEADRSLTCDNVLEKCTAFYVNSFSDNQIYQTVY